MSTGSGWRIGPSNDCCDCDIVECEECMKMSYVSSDGEGDSDGDNSEKSECVVVIGVCAMEKKSRSRPMTEILSRLEERFEYIKTIIFDENVILNEPVENWPKVDCLISFHSKGFPLDKANAYSELHKPFIINNLRMQYELQDRRKVYAILQREGIELPRYAVLDRDTPVGEGADLVETEDSVEVNGHVFNKPFVEKPISAEDHNIYIYYPTSAGGGSQRLFRKIHNRSSVYSSESRVRKTGSFIYEEFMPTDGTDVKVYTVGLDYAHAEARKSPALDGKVERDSEGKEVRYPVILTNAEKLIARRVCQSFKQMVCGFDLLRANGKSYVCDVNGFSFVKNSCKYYDDCAQILGHMVLRELSPQMHIPYTVPYQLEDPPFAPTTFGKMMELRCVCAVIRHGDRTPKQKMKMEVRHQKFFDIFAKYGGWQQGHVKLKHPKQLQEILDTARELLADPNWRNPKMEQLRSVLEMYGHFSGINRKVQMKYKSRDMTPPPSLDSSDTEWDSGFPGASSELTNLGSLTSSVSSTPGFPPSFARRPSEDSYLVLILKWGGELTPAGRVQAEELGRVFRCIYPGGQGEHAGEGLGLLRLHSTYRHDLKIYASDEGRVQMTAAAFAKGLLALEGELTPILVQMVKSANTNGLLDNDSDSSKCQNIAKTRLYEMLQVDHILTREERARMNPTGDMSVTSALNIMGNPAETCRKIHGCIRSLIQLATAKAQDPRTKDVTLYLGETWAWMLNRWGKLDKDFCGKDGKFDISKIPDIYDSIKYDLQHNQYTIQFPQTNELYALAKAMADIVIPQEYGLTAQEKLTIGQGICSPLLRKLRADMQRNLLEEADEAQESVNRLHPHYSRGVSSPSRHVRTRLYFTSESHIHSLMSILRYGGLIDESEDRQWHRAMEYVGAVSELSYLSQLVIMMYEDPTKESNSAEKFHIEVHFSPGVNCCVGKELPPGPGFRPQTCDSGSKSPPPPRTPSTSPPPTPPPATSTPQHVQQRASSTSPSPMWPRRDGGATANDVIMEEGSGVRSDGDDEDHDMHRRVRPGRVGFAHCRTPPRTRSSRSGSKEGSPTGDVFVRPKVVRGGSDPTSSSPPPLAHSTLSLPRASRTTGGTAVPPYAQQQGTGDLAGNDASCRIPRSSSVSEARGCAGSPQVRKHRHSFESTRSSPSMLRPTSSNRSLLGSSNTVSMFSTAVISGNVNLNDEERDPSEEGPIAVRACGGVPGIRPLETLHNALSLKQLDGFLGRLTTPSRSSSMKVRRRKFARCV